MNEYPTVQLNSTQICCLPSLLYDTKYKAVLKSNWILVLKFILLHHFQNILHHQEKNGSVSSSLHRSEKYTTGLGKDQRTHTVPLGFIHQQLTTSNGAIHKKGNENNSVYSFAKVFFLICINNTHNKYLPFFYIIICMPAKKWILPFLCAFT